MYGIERLVRAAERGIDSVAGTLEGLLLGDTAVGFFRGAREAAWSVIGVAYAVPALAGALAERPDRDAVLHRGELVF